MEIRLWIEPQFGASYEQQLAFVRAAESLGFPAVMRSDHLVNTASTSGLPGPSDAWVTLGALARETESIRLGTMMTASNFRPPSLLALSVAQVDQMSGGRIELGLGAGWFDREHEAFGFPFPPPPERFDRLEEQLEIITSFWATEDGFSYEGKHYTLLDCPGLPKPAQTPGPPIIIGGYGTRRTPELAARFAAEFNVGLVDPDVVAKQYARVREACEAIGRDPAELTFSSGTTVCCGETAPSIAAKMERGGVTAEELAEIGIGGTPSEVIDRILEFKDRGAERFYLRLLDIDDLDQVQLIAAEVVPAVTE